MSIKKLPLGIEIISSGVAGCIYEIQPLLLQYDISQEELDKFSHNLMEVLNGYNMPICGSMFWLLYKNICDKDIETLIDSVSTEEKKKVTRKKILSYNEYGIKNKE